MGTDVTGREKSGAALEPAEGAELRLDEGFELDGDALEALAVAGGKMPEVGCSHNWVFVRREKGLLWGYNKIYRCTKCDEEKTEWD